MLQCDLEGWKKAKIVEKVVLKNSDLHATNKEDHHRVEPCIIEEDDEIDTQYKETMDPFSWNMIRIKVEQ